MLVPMQKTALNLARNGQKWVVLALVSTVLCTMSDLLCGVAPVIYRQLAIFSCLKVICPSTCSLYSPFLLGDLISLEKSAKVATNIVVIQLLFSLDNPPDVQLLERPHGVRA
jgi:hypothetical protein